MDKMNMSESEKTYFKLTFLRDEFNKQIKKLEDHNKDLDLHIKGFVAHVDDLEKAPEKINAQIQKNLDNILHIVAERTAKQLAGLTEESVVKTTSKLSSAAEETSRTLKGAQSQLTKKAVWWHIAFGSGSVVASVLLFLVLHFFVFNDRIPTISLTGEVTRRLAWGEDFYKLLSKLSKKQSAALYDIIYKDKKPTEVFSKEIK